MNELLSSFIRKVSLSFPQGLRTMLFPFLCRWLLLSVANSRTERGLTCRPDRNWSFLKHTICCLRQDPKQANPMMLVQEKGILLRNDRISTVFRLFKILIYFRTISLSRKICSWDSVFWVGLRWLRLVWSVWFTTYFYSKLLLMKQCYCLCVV